MDESGQEEQVQKLRGFERTLMKKRAYVKDADLQVFVPTPAEAKKLENQHSFKDVLSRVYGDVNRLQHESDAQIQRLVAGETENIHEVTQAMDEAETSFELMMRIHQKLLEAYEKIQSMT